jgi:hypothetical protein
MSFLNNVNEKIKKFVVETGETLTIDKVVEILENGSVTTPVSTLNGRTVKENLLTTTFINSNIEENSLTVLDDKRALLTFYDINVGTSSTACAVVLKIQADNNIVFGTVANLHATTAQGMYNDSVLISENKVFVTYTYNLDHYGKILTINPTNLLTITQGAEFLIDDRTSNNIKDISVCKVSDNKVAVFSAYDSANGINSWILTLNLFTNTIISSVWNARLNTIGYLINSSLSCENKNNYIFLSYVFYGGGSYNLYNTVLKWENNSLTHLQSRIILSFPTGTSKVNRLRVTDDLTVINIVSEFTSYTSTSVLVFDKTTNLFNTGYTSTSINGGEIRNFILLRNNILCLLIATSSTTMSYAVGYLNSDNTISSISYTPLTGTTGRGLLCKMNDKNILLEIWATTSSNNNRPCILTVDISDANNALSVSNQNKASTEISDIQLGNIISNLNNLVQGSVYYTKDNGEIGLFPEKLIEPLGIAISETELLII